MPPLRKRASNRYWDIDQNTIQAHEESVIRGSIECAWSYSGCLCVLVPVACTCKCASYNKEASSAQVNGR
ncbi:hypothetical protein ACSBR1_042894 [Camellia fascicularis]